MVGEVKTKETYKEEIITMIKEIEDYKILRILHEFVKAGLKEEKAGRWTLPFLLEYKFFEKFT